ncbi:MAG TPA: cell division protein FtsZ, partial [Anaeromyxobacteraceae bacterium]
AADAEANIIFGSVIDERMAEEVKITVIATGFAGKESPARAAAPRQASLPVVAARPAAAKPVPAPVAELPREAPRPAPARAAAPAAARPPPLPRRAVDPAGFKPLDEDQYDIPAFLRRGGSAAE